MDVTVEKEGTQLTLTLNGKLDTTTADILEDIIEENKEDVQSCVLDLSKLEYISSIGLRIFLKTDRYFAAKSGLRVKNVNEVIMEVFEMTGFDDILTIE